MTPWVVPAITAITITPIAQREIVAVTRSQTPSHRSSSPGISTLPSDRLSLPTSVSRKRQMKMIVKAARKSPKKSPAMPSTALIVSGTETETLSAPDCTFSAAPESPIESSSLDSRRLCTVCGRSWRKSRTPPTSGTRNTSAISRTATAVPSTVTVAARPRDMCVFACTKRTGYSNTSPRKIPTNTIRNVSPISLKAARTPRWRRRAAPSASGAGALCADARRSCDHSLVAATHRGDRWCRPPRSPRGRAGDGTGRRRSPRAPRAWPPSSRRARPSARPS